MKDLLLPEFSQPLDHEMALLRAGRRRLVKREFSRDEDRTQALAEGFSVSLAEGGYGLDPETADVRLSAGAHLTLFVGDEAATSQALTLETIERHASGTERREAMAALGDLLGYPSCCVAAYLDQEDQGETTNFARLLQDGPRAGMPRANNLFVLSQQVISHFPCDLSCPSSAACGEEALELFRAQDPDAALALERLLSAPITIWDRVRFLVDHPIHGTLHGGHLTGEPRLSEHPGFQTFMAALPQRPPGGVQLRFDGGTP